MRLRRGVKLPPEQSGLRLGDLFSGIDLNRLHLTNVDDQAVFDECEPGDVVTAGPHGRVDILFPRELHGRSHIFWRPAVRNRCRFAVYHAVPDAAPGLVSG
jgi:hypothetical protein